VHSLSPAVNRSTRSPRKALKNSVPHFVHKTDLSLSKTDLSLSAWQRHKV
jgi:hypothetical protein